MSSIDGRAEEFGEVEDPVRDVFNEPRERAVIRTQDVYQMETEVGTIGYSDTLLSVIAHYTNSGRPKGYNAQCMVGKSKKGETALRLFAVIDPETETFVRAGFQSRGCLAVTACASAVCTMIEGKTFAEALSIKPDDIAAALDGVPSDKTYTPHFATEGVRALVGDYWFRRGMTLEDFNARKLCDDGSLSCILCENCSLRSFRMEKLVEGLSPAAPAACGSESAPDDAVEEARIETSAAAMAAGSEAAPLLAPVATGAAMSPVGGASPSADPSALPCEDPEKCAILENNALARAFDDVRKQSAEGHLVCATRWVDLGIIPPHMTEDEFEMTVYHYVCDHGCEEEKPKGAAAQKNPHIESRFRTATRPVGVPRFFDHARRGRTDADEAAEFDEGLPSTGEGAPVSSAPLRPIETNNDAVYDQVFGSLKLPDGYKLIERDGECVMVPLEDEDRFIPLKVECSTIAVLEGAYEYYLYDTRSMTSSFAHWAFLAAEGDDEATFADCVREESRVYPRPMPASGFSNRPFNKTPEEVEQMWKAVSESGRYPDIQRTVASNGDVFFFSTKHLAADYASSLAEWAAVGRSMSV